MEHLINPPARGGKDAGDCLFSPDRLVFEDHPMRADAEAVESLQFFTKWPDVTLFLQETFDRATQGVTRLGWQLPQILHHLVGDADRDHSVSRAEDGW